MWVAEKLDRKGLKFPLSPTNVFQHKKINGKSASTYQYHTTDVKRGMEIKYQAFNTFALHLG
jgi:hypothetical protein